MNLQTDPRSMQRADRRRLIRNPGEVDKTIHWLISSAAMMTGAIVELDFGMHLNAV